MAGYNAVLLVLVFFVITITVTVVLLALFRETLFWYWRTKGIMHEPKDILSNQNDTAFLMKESIAGLKAEESRLKAEENRRRVGTPP